jgi:hypothetical protein
MPRYYFLSSHINVILFTVSPNGAVIPFGVDTVLKLLLIFGLVDAAHGLSVQSLKVSAATPRNVTAPADCTMSANQVIPKKAIDF